MICNRMTWMAAALGVVAIGMVGCGKHQGPDKGSASINAVRMLSTADVSSVTVTITGGIPTPLTVPLVGHGTQYGALVSDLPVGTNYVFTASAKAADGTTELYHGAATAVTIAKSSTAAVIIDMNQVAPGVAISNEAPVIDSLTATSLLVSQTDTVTINASAHDPDAGQTAAMSWAWAATCGTVSVPTNTVGTDLVDGTSMVTFTAPAADGPCTVNVTVTDANGVLKNVASLTIQVNSAAANGNAKITANLDTYPVITGLNATPVPLVKGAPTTLTVTASDADGDALNYLWTVGPNTDGSGTCVGTFGTATAASTTFTLDAASTMAECTFLVRVDDGNFPDGTAKGGIITNHLSLPVSGPGNTVVGAPVFGYDYQQQTTIKGGDSVGLAIVANQGCTGGTLSLVWAASDSTALTPTTPAALGLDGSVFTSAVVYPAQPGAEDGSVITVTVTATCSTSHLSTAHVFTLVPLNSVCNGQADGTNCTATASASNKCVQAASCLAGVCHVDTSVTCSASSDACKTNSCDPADGACKLSNKPDTTTCDDANACTTGDVCTAGVCSGGAKVCPSGNSCQNATCNATTGACGLASKTDGTTCDDANLCTSTDVCTAGVCGGTAVSCNPGFVCTPATGTCDPKVCLAPGFGVKSDPLLSGLTSAADGTVWTTGSIYNPFNFGAGTVTATSSSDAYLNKLNPATGVATQSFTFGYVGGADQTGNLVAATQNGNVLVAGVYVTEIDFTPSVIAATGGTDNVDFLSKSSLAIGAPMNYFVVASAASVMPEITPVKAHNVDLGTGAFLASASNPAHNLVALCGKTGRLPGAYSATSATNTGLLTGTLPTFGGSTDIVVAVVDATTGTVVWGKEFGGAGDQQCQSVAIDATGNVYIAGNYNGTLSFGTGFSLPTVATSTTLGLPYVAKLSNTGTVLAAQTWGTAAVSDVLGIAVDSSSNVVIAGDLGVGANANFGAPVGTLNSSGKTDGFVVKLSSSLASSLWGFTFGDAAFDQAVLSLALSSGGDVFMGGAFTGTLTGLSGLASNGNTSTDAFTVQLSGATGAILCAQSYGDVAGNQNAAYLTVASAASNKVTFGGNFSGTMTLGSLTGSHVTLTAASNSGYVAGLVP